MYKGEILLGITLRKTSISSAAGGGGGGEEGVANTGPCLIIQGVKPPPLVTYVLLQGGRATLAAERKLSGVLRAVFLLGLPQLPKQRKRHASVN